MSFEEAKNYLRERGYSEEEIFEEYTIGFPYGSFVIDVIGIPIEQLEKGKYFTLNVCGSPHRRSEPYGRKE